jgi:uroporphyrinogen decarboxylase
MKLKSIERVKMALNHKEADRVPIDFGGTRNTSISTIAYNKLIKKLGLTRILPRTVDFIEQVVLVDLELLDIFHSDVIDPSYAFFESSKDFREFIIPNDGTKTLIPEYIFNRYDVTTDKNQTVLMKHKDGTLLGHMPKSAVHIRQTYWPYGDLPAIPEKINNKDLDKFSWAAPFPGLHLDLFDRNQFSLFRKLIKEFYEKTNRAIIFLVGCNIFDTGTTLRKFDNFLCDIYQDPKGTKRLVDKLVENNIKFLNKVIEAIGEYLLAIHFGDDLAHQNGLFISPEKYRKIFKPGHKKMWDYIHDNSNCKVFLHTCGAITELLPDLIEAGMDILNPVQTNAINMEPEKLKKEFGKDITFWGGGCDTKTLALKNSKAVKEEVKRTVDIFRRNGGYVFGSIHNITAEVPPENIIAMFEAAYDFGK